MSKLTLFAVGIVSIVMLSCKQEKQFDKNYYYEKGFYDGSVYSINNERQKWGKPSIIWADSNCIYWFRGAYQDKTIKHTFIPPCE